MHELFNNGSFIEPRERSYFYTHLLEDVYFFPSIPRQSNKQNYIMTNGKGGTTFNVFQDVHFNRGS